MANRDERNEKIVFEPHKYYKDDAPPTLHDLNTSTTYFLTVRDDSMLESKLQEK